MIRELEKLASTLEVRIDCVFLATLYVDRLMSQSTVSEKQVSLYAWTALMLAGTTCMAMTRQIYRERRAAALDCKTQVTA
jgi:hypothetical protein